MREFTLKELGGTDPRAYPMNSAQKLQYLLVPLGDIDSELLEVWVEELSRTGGVGKALGKMAARVVALREKGSDLILIWKELEMGGVGKITYPFFEEAVRMVVDVPTESIKLSEVIKIWERLRRRSGDGLHYCDLKIAFKNILDIKDDVHASICPFKATCSIAGGVK